jgi:type IV secretion system protein VirB10
MTVPPPLRPLLPLARRLNRNALIVTAVIVGMTVLTAVVVVQPTRDAPPRAAQSVDDDPPSASSPTFLDQPARVAAETGAMLGAPLGGRAASPPRDPGSSAPVSVAAQEPSLRERAYRTALVSPAVSTPAPLAAPGVLSGLLATDSVPLAAQERQLLNLGDSVIRASVGEVGPGPLGSASRSADRRHREFFEAVGQGGSARLNSVLEPSGSAYTLRAGTVIPGLLLTAIISDLPGDLVGQVSRDVYDSKTERLLLIPKGARLIGTYDNQVAAGEDRLLVAWTRLIFPDGRSLRLPGLALKDRQGQTGAKDHVDTHWRSIFGSALLLSAISAGVQLSQPQQTSFLAPPSTGQIAGGAVGQELSSVALEMLRRRIDRPPTITIRAGQAFNVFLNGDLVFSGPYIEEGQGAP